MVEEELEKKTAEKSNSLEQYPTNNSKEIDLSTTVDLSQSIDRNSENPQAILSTSLKEKEKPHTIDAPKIYSYSQLTTHPLPKDVDRGNLERHLSKEEFQQLFNTSFEEFSKMPTWRKILKRKEKKLY